MKGHLPQHVRASQAVTAAISGLRPAGWARGESNNDADAAPASPSVALVELRRQCIASALTYAIVAAGGLMMAP